MSRVKSIVKLIVLALVLIVAVMVGYTKISYGGHVDYGEIDLSFLGGQIDNDSYYLLIIFSPLDCHNIK